MNCINIENALSEIERSVTESTFNSSGPFSVYLLGSTDGNAASESSAPLVLEADVVTPNEPVASPVSQTETVDSEANSSTGLRDLGDNGIVETTLEQEPDLPTCHSHHPEDGDVDTSRGMQTLHGTEMPGNIESFLGIPTTSLRLDDTQASAPTSLASGPVPDDTAANAGFLDLEVKHLLRNYASNVLNIFSPLGTLDTPWRRFHLARSLQSSIEMEILGHSAPSLRALLYTVLTISAYNLRNIPSSTASNGFNQYWNEVAARYKCKALKLLESCIRDQTTSLSNSVYNELLAAMLCMVTIDVSTTMPSTLKG